TPRWPLPPIPRERAGSQADDADTHGALSLLRGDRLADAGGHLVVAGEVAPRRAGHVLLAVHDGAVKEAPQVVCLPGRAIFLHPQHAVEIAHREAHVILE